MSEQDPSTGKQPSRLRNQNARRHGLSVPLKRDGPEWLHVTQLAKVILGSLPRTEKSWTWAMQAATSHLILEKIQAVRTSFFERLQRAEDAGSRSEVRDLKMPSKGSSHALNQGEVPSQGKIAAAGWVAIGQLERYERRALSQIHRALERLAGSAISAKYQGK